MSIMLSDFEKLIGQAYVLDKEIDDIKRDQLKPKEMELALLEAKILTTLEQHEMSSYKSAHGTVIRSVRYSVRVPKDIEAKVEFFKWLNDKGRDVYWTYTTINSQSLNSLYKAEMEAAKEAGDFDFAIPGLGAPEGQPILSRRKK